MDYEKKYKEALERARKLHSKYRTIIGTNIPEEIFPELKESEDEKVRQEIRNFIWDYPEKLPERDKWLAWLKSLKDRVQPKQEWSEEDKHSSERLLGWLDTLINYIHHDAIVSLDLRRERIQQVKQLKTWLKSLRPQIGGSQLKKGD